MATNISGEGTECLKGFFTKQLYLQGQTLREIEIRLGFHEGRLKKGARFYTPLMLPNVDNFNIAGYTQVADHHTDEQYGADLNKPHGRSARDAYQNSKKHVLSGWKLFGSDRLIKVKPVTGHDNYMSPDVQYRAGSGIPQWKMINEISCRLISFVTDWEGRFIPDQGYVEVKYK